MGTHLFRHLYTLADSLVVGRLVGVNTLAAVGATGFWSWLVLDIVLGFTQGFGVLFAQRFGAKDEAGLRRAATASPWLCAALALLLTALGIGLAPAVLRAVDTSPELMGGALMYLNWILSGTWIAVGYNLVGSMLRAFGDSKAPLVAVILAGVANVALDVVLVGPFHTGVAGAAIQGMGYTFVPMLSGFVELAPRILSVLLAGGFLGAGGVYFADGLGWIGAMVLECISYPIARKRFQAGPAARGLGPSPPFFCKIVE